MKKHLSTIALVLILIAGVVLLAYPTFSDWWNSMHSSRTIASYDQIISNKTDEDYQVFFDEAQAYNQQLAEIRFPLMQHDRVEGYEGLLDVAGNGVMGYIDIPKIKVQLPIYHGSSESVLQIAVGHVEGTSLPTGGEGTHCVLSAHRGLPSAKLFSDLDKMEVGDTFTLTIIDRVLTYQVDQILIVEPEEVEPLYVVEGEDYCTLVTCTPYGVNTHRMLVRGHRVDNGREQTVVRVMADAVQVQAVIVAPFLASPILLVMLVGLLIPKRRRSWRDSQL